MREEKRRRRENLREARTVADGEAERRKYRTGGIGGQEEGRETVCIKARSRARFLRPRDLFATKSSATTKGDRSFDKRFAAGPDREREEESRR